MKDKVGQEGRPLPSRRDFITLGIGALVVAGLPSAIRGRPVLVRRSLPVMGTVAEVAVVHRDEAYAQRAISAALDALRWVDATMTRFDAASDVGRANLRAAREAVAITPETAEVLAESLRWAKASGGLFDPTIGRAIQLWNVGQRREPVAAAESRRLAGRGLWQALELDSQGGRPVVRFRDEQVALDLGGIAKGYGVDRAVAALRDFGIGNALVNVGGDLYALGHSPEGDAWRVGIQSPDDPARLAGTLHVADAAVATSGDYLQYFQHGGRRYHHLLDPRTGEPRRTGVRSLTVTAPSCMAADAAATAAFGLPAAEAERLIAVGGARVGRMIDA
jgi:FAD:protein FMN transferase